MASLVTKIEFFNVGVSPTIKMGEIVGTETVPIPEDFTVTFEDPPVTDNYYADLRAIATFENGAYSNASEDVECYLGITPTSVFDTPSIEYKTSETAIDVDSTLDLSFVSEFEINALAIPSFSFEYRKSDTQEWTVVSMDSLTLTDNVFTGTYELDITDDEVYACRIKALDANGDTSGYSPTKYIIKNIVVGWDNDGTDGITWDNAGSDSVLY